MDVWEQGSDCDEAELRRACGDMGLEVYVDDEKHDPKRDSYIHIVERGVSVRIMERAYVHVVRRGDNCVVGLPQEFPVVSFGYFGQLFVFAPEPALLVALKLGRGKPQDIDDAQWLVTARGLSRDAIEAAIAMLPHAPQRECAARKSATCVQGMHEPIALRRSAGIPQGFYGRL